MANTSVIYTRVDNDIKKGSEEIFNELGITMSSAIQMFLRQVIMRRGMPFSLSLPYPEPKSLGSMTRTELDAAIEKSLESVKAGRTYTADEVDELFSRELGI